MFNPSYESISSTDVLEYLPALRALARALTKHSANADDLVQETLLKAIASIDQFQPGSNLRAWLLTIMRHTYYTNAKRAMREQVGSVDCVSGNAWVRPEQESGVLGREVLAVINRLPFHHREVVVLILMVGESYEDTARICGCTVGTIKSRLNRARLAIMCELGGK